MANKNVIWCDEATLSKDIRGKTYIVTGANSGVGFETTKQLIKQGGHVVMACRRPDVAEEVAKDFKGLKGSYEIIKCDLADLSSVREFVKEFLSRYDKLDGLMCNAGMVCMKNEPVYTKDGFELTMATSFFGHFLMSELLLETLKNSAPSRMAIVSSVVHANSPKKRYRVHLDDINFKERKFSNFDAYGEAKVAVTLYAKELAERLKGTGVATASIHPGWARSNFGSGGGIVMKTLMALARPLTYFISNSSWESSQASLHCLLSDDAPKHSGAYFSQHSVLYGDKECRKGGFPMETPNPNARDMDTAKKLVEMARKMVGLEA